MYLAAAMLGVGGKPAYVKSVFDGNATVEMVSSYCIIQWRVYRANKTTTEAAFGCN